MSVISLEDNVWSSFWEICTLMLKCLSSTVYFVQTRMVRRSNGNILAAFFSAPDTIILHKWHHIVLVYDYAGGDLRVYMNGTQVVYGNYGSISMLTTKYIQVGSHGNQKYVLLDLMYRYRNPWEFDAQFYTCIILRWCVGEIFGRFTENACRWNCGVLWYLCIIKKSEGIWNVPIYLCVQFPTCLLHPLE